MFSQELYTDNSLGPMKVVRPGNSDQFCGSFIENCDYCGEYDDSLNKTHRGCIACKYGYQIQMFKTETVDGDSYFFSKCIPDQTQLILKVRDGTASDPKCSIPHCDFCLKRPLENGNYQYGCVSCQKRFVVTAEDEADEVFARCQPQATEQFTFGIYAERKRFQIAKLTFFLYAVLVS